MLPNACAAATTGELFDQCSHVSAYLWVLAVMSRVVVTELKDIVLSFPLPSQENEHIDDWGFM